MAHFRNLFQNNLMRVTLLIGLVAGLTFVPWPVISFPAAWLLLTVLPGMPLLRWLGLYVHWREPRTLILSATIGLLISPIFLHWTGLLFGFSRPVALLTLLGLNLGLVLLDYFFEAETDSVMPLVGSTRQGAVLLGVLMLTTGAVLLPYLRGYTAAGVYPVEMSDWFKHYGMAWAIRHTGVPPVDIFFYGDPERGRLAYYYFFHLSVATLDLLHSGPSSIYGAFVGLALTAALTFCLTFYCLAQKVLTNNKAVLWALLFVTVVGGLDIIPIIPHTLNRFARDFPGQPATLAATLINADHIDGWAPATFLRLNALYVHYIWVPQHVTGLLAFTLGLYLFRVAPRRGRMAAVIPLVLLAILGHSSWIGLVALGCVTLYGLYDSVSRWRAADGRAGLKVLGGYTLVGLATLLVSGPLLRELLSPAAPKSGLSFEIPHPGDWWPLAPFHLFLADSIWSRLLDLPVHYFFELGAVLLCGLIGLWIFRRRRPQEPLLPLLMLTVGVGFVVISFFASGRSWTALGFTLNNDLGIRAIMPAQAVLALFAGYYLGNFTTIHRATWRRAVWAGALGLLLILGSLSVAWEVWAMGGAKYLRPPRIDAATYQAFQAMPALTEPLSVVKHRTHDQASAYQLLFADRPPGFFTVEAAVFHPDLNEVIYQFGLSRFAYLNSLPVWSYQMFRQMYANYVYVGADDRTEDLSPEKFENPTYYEKIYEKDDVAIYKLRDLSLDQQQARFGPAGVQFMGHLIDEAPVYPAGFANQTAKALVTAWRLEQPVEQDYTVYIHFLEANGEIVAQADHQLWSWAQETEGPTSTWDAGVTYLDLIALPPAVLNSTEPLQIVMGVWLPDTGEYLPAEPVQLNLDAQQRLIVGSYPPLSPQ